MKRPSPVISRVFNWSTPSIMDAFQQRAGRHGFESERPWLAPENRAPLCLWLTCYPLGALLTEKHHTPEKIQHIRKFPICWKDWCVSSSNVPFEGGGGKWTDCFDVTITFCQCSCSCRAFSNQCRYCKRSSYYLGKSLCLSVCLSSIFYHIWHMVVKCHCWSVTVWQSLNPLFLFLLVFFSS